MSEWILAHVVTRLELGGAQLATLHEVEHSTFGARPHYLLYGPGGMLDADLHRLQGVEAIPIQALGRAIEPRDDARAFKQLFDAFRDLKRRHPTKRLLVHTHSSKAGILGRFAAKAARVDKIVHSIHGFGHQPDMPKHIFYALWASERAACAVTDGLTADSAANILRGRSEHLWRHVPAQVVHCGIDVNAFAQPKGDLNALRAELGIGPTTAVVLMVANLKPQKDPLTFVAVAERVCTAAPDTVFLLAGDGELRGPMLARIAAANLRDKVKILGWRRDIPDLLHLCNVLLLTSRWEGLPQVFAQAMAAGKPIVATDVDGNREAVQDGVNGFVRAVGDVRGLAAATLALVQEPKFAQRLGQAGIAHVGAFSQEAMIDALDMFYATLTRD